MRGAIGVTASRRGPRRAVRQPQRFLPPSARDAGPGGLHRLRARGIARGAETEGRSSTPPVLSRGCPVRPARESAVDGDRKIRQNVGRLPRFCPDLVGETAQRRLEAFFRREWSYARGSARAGAFAKAPCSSCPIAPSTGTTEGRRGGAGKTRSPPTSRGSPAVRSPQRAHGDC